MPSVEVWMKRGNTRPSFSVQLRENVGTPDERPVDLRNFDAINLLFKTEGSTDPASIGAMFVLYPDAAPDDVDFEEKGGWVQYDWIDGDLDVHGEYDMEAKVTWAPGAVETFPNKGYWKLHVGLDLG